MLCGLWFIGTTAVYNIYYTWERNGRNAIVACIYSNKCESHACFLGELSDVILFMAKIFKSVDITKNNSAVENNFILRRNECLSIFSALQCWNLGVVDLRFIINSGSLIEKNSSRLSF